MRTLRTESRRVASAKRACSTNAAGVSPNRSLNARANWRGLATGLAIVVIGIVGAFAGPAGAWAVAAVGLCAMLLSSAAAIAWQQRA